MSDRKGYVMVKGSAGPVRVVTVDPADEATFHLGYQAFRAGATADRVDPVPLSFPELLAEHRAVDHARRREFIVAFRDGLAVGAGHLEFPLRDNRTLLRLDPAVPPEHRGSGVGQALFAYVCERARQEGRTNLLAELALPISGEPTPGVRFAERHGFTRRNTEVRRTLSVPVDPDRLDELARYAAERTGGYVLRSWAGPCPEEYAEEYARLKGLLMVEAPTGEMEYESEVWDVQRLREDERLVAAQQRTQYVSIAMAPDGRVVGHTQVVVPATDPGRAFQWDTLVLPEHRGHRLGLALKVENLRRLQAAHPDVTSITTWNAEQNGPMIAVNEALGFRPVELMQEWQREL